MRRREFIAGLGGAASAAAAWSPVARAQQRNQIKRIAFITGAGATVDVPIKQELAKLGWIEGRNLRIETLVPVDGRMVRAAAPYVVSTAPDLILVINTEYAQILKEATDTIPIVFAFVADPVVSHLVQSFARPGGNLTGFPNLPQPSLAGKWLSLLNGVVPSIERVMVLHDPANAVFASALHEAAPALNVKIHPAPVTAIADAGREIETFARDPGAGMIVVPFALSIAERAKITALAARYRLPAIYGADVFVFVGGLMSYANVTDEIFRGVAQYADRILKGAKPADLPVQAPTRFKFIINMPTARSLGIDVPPTMLAVADKVIE